MPRDGSPCRRISAPCCRSAAIRELYALRALDVAALDVGGMDLLDRYEQRIALEDPFLQTADDMSFFCHGDGAFLKLDQDGRITVSDFIREHTGITADVAFVGRGQFLPDMGTAAAQGLWRRGALAGWSGFARWRRKSGRQGIRSDGWPWRGDPRRWRTGQPHSGPSQRGRDRPRARCRPDHRRRDVRGRRLYQDAARRRRQCRGDRPRPRRDRGRRRSCHGIFRAAEAGARAVLQARRICRGNGRWRRARHRRVVDAARPAGSRLFLPQRRPARHAHGAGPARLLPTSSTASSQATLRASSASSARSGMPAASRA